MTIARASTRIWLAIISPALFACGSDSATTPSGGPAPRLFVGVTGGASQQAFAGNTLPNPVTVQVVDSAGRAVAGQRRIRFLVAPSNGTVSDTVVLSGVDGTASVTWRLGADVGAQSMAVSLADHRANDATQVYAQSVSLSGADLVVVRGATSGTIGILFREDGYFTTQTLTWPDTILRLLPRGPGLRAEGTKESEEVVAFTIGHPPASVVRPWTDGVDTVRLDLKPPIAVAFTIWATHDFDSTVARARRDLANLDQLWRTHMTGVVVGTVHIMNAPDLAPETDVCAGSVPHDASSINVYYVDRFVGDQHPALDCDAGTIFMGSTTVWTSTPDYRNLLGHEVGHAMSWDHLDDPGALMHGLSPWGDGITTGEIYRMHFYSHSALNAVFGIHPPAEQNCSLPFSSFCPAQTFTAW